MADHLAIGVIGAGLMGHGVAQVFAAAGHWVKVQDSQPAALETLHARIAANLDALGEPHDCVARVSGHADIEEAVAQADIIIEAAPEDLAVKRAIFARIEQHAPAKALIASNTSVIPIGRITAGFATAQRMLGTHWWNPPFLVPLVEVIGASATDPAHIAWMISVLRSVGKTPVEVKRDVAGFVGNRLQHALWREAIALVEEGICDAETVDTVVKASFGRRLAVLGPLENADLVGTDLTLAIHRTVLPEINSRPGPSPLLEALVTSGRLGMKSGEGFRRWRNEDAAALKAKVAAHLLRLNRTEQADIERQGNKNGRETS